MHSDLTLIKIYVFLALMRHTTAMFDPLEKKLTEAMPIRDALATVLRNAKGDKQRKFAETVDLAIQLGVDPRKPNQSVRGVQTLPNGTGKAVRVAVFARGDVRVMARRLRRVRGRRIKSESAVCMINMHNLLRTYEWGRCVDFFEAK